MHYSPVFGPGLIEGTHRIGGPTRTSSYSPVFGPGLIEGGVEERANFTDLAYSPVFGPGLIEARLNQNGLAVLRTQPSLHRVNWIDVRLTLG